MIRSSALLFACLGLVSACGDTTSSRKAQFDASTPDGSGTSDGTGGRGTGGDTSSVGGASNGGASNGGSSGAGGTSSSGGARGDADADAGDASVGGNGGSGAAGNGGSGAAGNGGSGAAGNGGSGAAGNGGTNGKDASAGDLDGSIVDASGDAQTCSYGAIGGYTTQAQVDLYGTTIDYFNGGDPLPPGLYRLTYVSGCMQYANNQGWTINAYPSGGAALWWAVGATTSDRIVVPPGTVGIFPGDGYLGGGYATFDECVAANLANDKPVDFQFAGGKLGIWLLDDNYGDNLTGPNNASPVWNLTLLGACVGPDK